MITFFMTKEEKIVLNIINSLLNEPDLITKWSYVGVYVNSNDKESHIQYKLETDNTIFQVVPLKTDFEYNWDNTSVFSYGKSYRIMIKDERGYWETSYYQNNSYSIQFFFKLNALFKKHVKPLIDEHKNNKKQKELQEQQETKSKNLKSLISLNNDLVINQDQNYQPKQNYGKLHLIKSK